MTAAMVLGSASCVWEDVAALEALVGGPWPGLVIAVNDAAAAWPRRLDHLATQHPERLSVWKEARAKAGGNSDYRTWGCIWPTRKKDPGLALVDDAVEAWGAGSSGLHAVTVAYHLGIERIVLCGVPMQIAEHFPGAILADKGPWRWAPKHHRPWIERTELLRERTRSMSGWTRELLGAPDLGWLNLQEAA